MDQIAKRDAGKPMGEYSAEFDRLRQARLKLAVFHSGMTAREIAEKAGISRSTLQQYLYCGVMPGADTLAALCQALKVNPAWVLGLSERREM